VEIYKVILVLAIIAAISAAIGVTYMAKKGNSDAQYLMGVAYFVSKDYTKAAELYRKSAEQGNIDAQFPLGNMYINGEGVKQDDAEAAKWLYKPAENGDCHAQYGLGLIYARYNTEQGFVEAYKWLSKSANQGCVEGQFGLGVAYSRGRGIPKDNDEAIKWFRKAAAQNSEKYKEAAIKE